MNIYWYLSDLHACGLVRGEVLARSINSRIRNTNVICKREILASDLMSANVAVFQRTSKAEFVDRVEYATGLGIKTIYDVDDDMFSIPKSLGKAYIHYSKPETQLAIKAAIGACDAVTASTDYLARRIKGSIPDSKRVFVAENFVDIGEHAEHLMMRKQIIAGRDDIVVGWFGSGSHKEDLVGIRAFVKDCLTHSDCIRFSFVGLFDEDDIKDFGEHRDRVDIFEWMDYPTLKNWMAHIDIGLALVADNEFNRSKSAVKWMQYSALGIPTICSNVECYSPVKNMETGVVVEAGDAKGVAGAITELAANEKLRDELGYNAYADVKENHGSEKNSLKWLDICGILLDK